MHQNHSQITILLVPDPLSSSAYPMITYTPPVEANNLPIKTLVAGQQPTNVYTCSFANALRVYTVKLLLLQRQKNVHVERHIPSSLTFLRLGSSN